MTLYRLMQLASFRVDVGECAHLHVPHPSDSCSVLSRARLHTCMDLLG